MVKNKVWDILKAAADNGSNVDLTLVCGESAARKYFWSYVNEVDKDLPSKILVRFEKVAKTFVHAKKIVTSNKLGGTSVNETQKVKRHHSVGSSIIEKSDAKRQAIWKTLQEAKETACGHVDLSVGLGSEPCVRKWYWAFVDHLDPTFPANFQIKFPGSKNFVFPARIDVDTKSYRLRDDWKMPEGFSKATPISKAEITGKVEPKTAPVPVEDKDPETEKLRKLNPGDPLRTNSFLEGEVDRLLRVTHGLGLGKQQAEFACEKACKERDEYKRLYEFSKSGDSLSGPYKQIVEEKRKLQNDFDNLKQETMKLRDAQGFPLTAIRFICGSCKSPKTTVKMTTDGKLIVASCEDCGKLAVNTPKELLVVHSF